jgi:threonine/homoserine/homoserine lactone efflux protein
MNLFLKGLPLGITLAIMIGPIFFALVQTGLERGWRGGLVVGLGIWISDIVFIISCFFGLKVLAEITSGPGFKLWLGISGGIILLLFGIGLLVKKQQDFDLERPHHKPKDIAGFLTKGVLVNSANPFTFFFWISISLGVIAKEAQDWSTVFPFYLGIMLPVVIGDSAKVIAADWIRGHIRQKHIHLLRLISGIAFIAFGIGLILRVTVW